MSRNYRLEHKVRILQCIWERKEVLRGDDGYWVFWPHENHGCYSEADLRVIADLLADANRKWDNELIAFFKEQQWKQ